MDGDDCLIDDLTAVLEDAEEILHIHRLIERKGGETLKFHYAVQRNGARRSSTLGKIVDELDFSRKVFSGMRRLRDKWLVHGVDPVVQSARELGLTKRDIEILRAVAAYMAECE